MQCPICQVDLLMSEKQGIEIDYCPKCRGIWLDRGELEKIIEKSSSESPPQSPGNFGSPRGGIHYQEHDKHKDDDDHEHGHRRKSFLRDIFD